MTFHQKKRHKPVINVTFWLKMWHFLPQHPTPIPYRFFLIFQFFCKKIGKLKRNLNLFNFSIFFSKNWKIKKKQKPKCCRGWKISNTQPIIQNFAKFLSRLCKNKAQNEILGKNFGKWCITAFTKNFEIFS